MWITLILEKKVFPEPLIDDLFFQVLVGGGDEAHVPRPFPPSPPRSANRFS